VGVCDRVLSAVLLAHPVDFAEDEADFTLDREVTSDTLGALDNEPPPRSVPETETVDVREDTKESDAWGERDALEDPEEDSLTVATSVKVCNKVLCGVLLAHPVVVCEIDAKVVLERESTDDALGTIVNVPPSILEGETKLDTLGDDDIDTVTVTRL
jgi:hypothetical protein